MIDLLQFFSEVEKLRPEESEFNNLFIMYLIIRNVT